MRNVKIIVIAVIIMIAAIGFPVRGSAVKFKHITQDQGLSQNSVFAIMQDSNGFMWFGTQDGLNRYDGYEFIIYRPEPGNPGGLIDNDVSSICEDSDGYIWIGTPGSGLSRFDRRTGTFRQYRHLPGSNASLSHDYIGKLLEDSRGDMWIGTGRGLNRYDRDTDGFIYVALGTGDSEETEGPGITEIYEDHSGVLWIGTAMAGLYRYDREKGTFTAYRAEFSNPQALTSNRINLIYEDQKGVFWLGTEFGLNVMDRKKGTFERYLSLPGESGSLSHNLVQSMGEDASGQLWVGTLEGLNRFDRKTGRFIRYRYDPDNPTGISHDNIIDIFRSRSGILWMGTPGGGLTVLDYYGNRFDTYRGEPNNPTGLSHNMVYSFSQAPDGNIWIATQGGGISRFNPETDQFSQFRTDPQKRNSLVSNYLSCVLADRDGIIWIGTIGAGLNRFDPGNGTFSLLRFDPGNPSGISSNFIRTMTQSRGDAGYIWLGTLGGGLNRMDPKTGNCIRYSLHIEGDPDSMRGNGIRALIEDRDGILWIGTHGGGLYRFDPETAAFKRFFNRKDDPATLTIDYIGCLHEDHEGNLWIGTLGGGLNMMDRKTGKFSSYRNTEGLPNDVVYGILEDERGHLWISTNNGISKFDADTRSFHNFCVQDGLQSNEFNGGACLRASDGRMYFGGVKGFSAFYPEEVKSNPYMPPVVITDFQLFNKPVPIQPGPGSLLPQHISYVKEIRLSHKYNVISFEFAALNYSIPDKNRYSYKLEGFDESWVFTGSRKRFAYYTNLDPGTYVFRVRGSNNDGIWNDEGASLTIVVEPPFWKTWWFQLLGLLVILTLSVWAYKNRTRELSQRTRLQTELQTARNAQMSIMPQSDPLIPGFDISGTCVPANEVGGDFFDYIWLNEEKTRFGIAIGDVSGKAMKAAMTAVMSSGILFSKANESQSIREIMTRVNRPLYLKTDRSMFTALCLMSLCTETRQMIFTNAGLHSPLLKSGQQLTSIKGEGSKFPLGLLKDNEYQETNTQLNSGDVVVLFTDGVLDSQNSAGDFYGLKKLEALLRERDTETMCAREIKDAIISDACRFAGSEPQQDDMTVVVVKTL